MRPFLIQSVNNHEAVTLAFEVDGARLNCLGEEGGIPNAIVQAFDPVRDISYELPEPLTVGELEEEARIHVPASLRKQIDRVLMPSTLGHKVLMQFVERLAPAISPLSALASPVVAAGGANAALLQADDSALTFVRRAGEEIEPFFAPFPLTQLLVMSPETRERVVPGFNASEVLVAGYDVDRIERFALDPLVTARRIAPADLAAICTFAESSNITEENLNRYTLAIGAAWVYATIQREGSLD